MNSVGKWVILMTGIELQIVWFAITRLPDYSITNFFSGRECLS